jgi:hypothetical protein
MDDDLSSVFPAANVSTLTPLFNRNCLGRTKAPFAL